MFIFVHILNKYEIELYNKRVFHKNFIYFNFFDVIFNISEKNCSKCYSGSKEHMYIWEELRTVLKQFIRNTAYDIFHFRDYYFTLTP